MELFRRRGTYDFKDGQDVPAFGAGKTTVPNEADIVLEEAETADFAGAGDADGSDEAASPAAGDVETAGAVADSSESTADAAAGEEGRRDDTAASAEAVAGVSVNATATMDPEAPQVEEEAAPEAAIAAQ